MKISYFTARPHAGTILVAAMLVAGCGEPVTPQTPADASPVDPSLGDANLPPPPPAPTCSDGGHNGDESDVDCGGACGPCTDGSSCDAPGDCLSQVCDGGTCMAARCGDGIVSPAAGEECDDGNVTDTDDCTFICELADCTDGIMNADEIDVDCGGHCGPNSCHGGQTCDGDSDCASYSCVAGMCEPGRGIVTGFAHTCVLLQTGAVRCWGHNSDGQLGYGHALDIGDNELPSSAGDVSVGGTVVQLAAGWHHTCALLDTGAVRCWGRNNVGQLGYGHTSYIGDNELPSSAGTVDVGGTVVQLAAGGVHTCALLDTGAVRCWGNNRDGQLGYGHTWDIGDDELPSSAGDVSVGGTVVQLAAGLEQNCALLDTGAVRCWGRNTAGKLGYGHTNDIGDNELPSSAGEVSIGGSAVQIAAGIHHACALLDTGAVRCWGYNYNGQLGYGHTSSIGDNELPSSAGPVSLGDTATELISSAHHNCVLLSGGGLRCWGWNSDGRLGYGHVNDIGDNELPSSVGDVSVGGTVAELSVGLGLHTCVRLATSAVRCWGYNSDGQLGYGHTNDIGDNELPSSAGDVPYQ